MRVSPGARGFAPKRGAQFVRAAFSRCVVPAVLAAVVLVAWGGMLRGRLVSDDWVWLERARRGVVIEPGQFFRPGCACSWGIQEHMPASLLHAADLAVHWLCAWQLARIIPALGGTAEAGVAVAAVFAASPALHEAVCWPSARCGPLAAACVLAAAVTLLGGGNGVIAIALLVVAVTVQESAVALMWGLPLLLGATGRRKEALRWGFGLLGLSGGYWAVTRAVGAHTRLTGGYVAPFRMERALSHLGAYLGMAVGVGGAGSWWPLWPALGLAAVAFGSRKRAWVVAAAWVWASVAMLPFLRLGGPEQPRFLYVMLLPIMTGFGCLLSRVRHTPFRRFLPALGLLAAAAMVPGSWAACREWVAAGRRVASVVHRVATAFPVDTPVIAVNPPEFHARAHLFRNGLFAALRLTTGLPYQGLTLPPSEGVRRCGQLREWLQRRAPGQLSNPQAEAWIFIGDNACRLKGWREEPDTERRLTAMCEER